MSDYEFPCRVDLAHLGMLCRRIREAHAISQKTMAAQCEVHPATIERFELQTGSTSENTYTKYVQALRSKDVVGRHGPISLRHASILNRLYELYNGRTKDEQQKLQKQLCSLAALSFTHILPGRRSRQLDALVELLVKEERPALIMDDLWFIHAVNGTLLRLFDVKPDDPLFDKWDGWHGLGNKIRESSTVRQRHPDTDKIIPPTNAYFFEDGRTYPHLFSPQMRHLVCGLFKLSEQEKFDFHEWWEHATEFILPFRRASQPRVILSHDQRLTVYPSVEIPQKVKLDNGYTVRYALSVWDHDGSATGQEAFKSAHNGKHVSIGDILYAADYDMKHDFHVNTWPAVKQEIATWDCE